MNFIGIHIGVREVRGILVDETGTVRCRSGIQIADKVHLDQNPELLSRTDSRLCGNDRDKPHIEQDPELLWEKVINCLRELLASTPEVTALGVSSTPGTVIPVDADAKVLYPAIVGEDKRNEIDVKIVNEKSGNLSKKTGCRFDTSSALTKILWLKRERSETYKKTRKFIGISDFIVGKLTGEFSVTDTSNALHAGYDIVDMRWPAFIREFSLLPENMPEVVEPGKVIGRIQKSFADEINLSTHTQVIAGTTDEMTLLISSGAISPGQWNSQLGRKLTVRGISSKLIKDKLFRIYSLLHPENSWIAVGKSSVGKCSLEGRFSDEDLEQMEKRITEIPLRNETSNAPSSLIVYPLNQQGEILPFLNPDAQGFIIGKPRDKYDLYSGYLEGIGFVEKWIFEFLEELGFEMSKEIHVTGLSNPGWLQMRANILEKIIIKPETGLPEKGAAILAASKTSFSNLSEAVKSMVNIEKHIEPQSSICGIYSEKYRKFRRICRAIGYE